MNKQESAFEGLTKEQILLKRSDIMLAHVWNIIINGGDFKEIDLNCMQKLGTDISNYWRCK